MLQVKNIEKKVATSLINYINNKIMKPTYRLSAGTQKNNLAAIKMYKKLGFIKKNRDILLPYSWKINFKKLCKMKF